MGRPSKCNYPNEKNCEVCGNEFYVKPSQYLKVFCCSIGCNKIRRKYAMPKREAHYNWKGGETYNELLGYEMIKVEGHRGANSRGYIYKHRYVMEGHLGRELEEWEVVHHIDGNKRNNDISNLMLLTQEEHTKLHYEQNIQNCGVHYSAKLSQLNVADIYTRAKDGESYKDISNDYNITPENVGYIKNKCIWRVITDKLDKREMYNIEKQNSCIR